MKLINVSKAAELLNLSASKVYAMVSKGELPAYRLGGAIRLDEEELREFLLESCRNRPKTEAPKRRQDLRQLLS